MVRTGFKKRIDIRSVLNTLNSSDTYVNTNELIDREIMIQEGVYITFFEVSFTNSFKIVTRPATYSVYCCQLDENSNTVTVFQSSEQSNYSRNVSARIEVACTFEPAQRKGVFGKKTKSRYAVKIPNIPNYKEGLFYRIGDTGNVYPITETMTSRSFFVDCENSEKIHIFSQLSDGYDVVEI